MKIRYLEMFLSLQGEALYSGTPSLFFRVFGCNFRCKKFGRPRDEDVGTHNPEVKEVIANISKYKTLDDLPLVHTGCDSYASIYPEFKRFAHTEEIGTIVDKMQQSLPNGKFGPVHLVITGGEPLLGWQRSYCELIDEINSRGMELSHITFETNGTQKLTEKLIDAIRKWQVEITFSISAKMPSSGELWEDAILPDVVKTYLSVDSPCNHYFKFVVSSPDDLADVEKAINQYKESNVEIPVYIMPAGGTEQGYFKNKQWVAKECLARGYRFAQRLHIDLYGNQWGT